MHRVLRFQSFDCGNTGGLAPPSILPTAVQFPPDLTAPFHLTTAWLRLDDGLRRAGAAGRESVVCATSGISAAGTELTTSPATPPSGDAALIGDEPAEAYDMRDEGEAPPRDGRGGVPPLSL